MSFRYAYTIHGRPVSKKNSRPIRMKRDGRRFVGNHDRYLAWADDAILELRCQRGSVPTLSNRTRVHVDVVVYLAKGQAMDSDGALSAPFDALEDAGVLANDAQIKSHTIRMSRDWKDPRVEMVVRPYGGDRCR